MNLPNQLTLLRIFFVPLLVAALLMEKRTFNVAGVELDNALIALIIFLVAAGTDLLDGYLARRWQQITTVGTLLDPIADKLLISAALISLVQIHVVDAWLVVLIIGREFAVSGLRSIAASAGYTIKASDLGKTKMVFQVAAVSLLMLGIHWPELKIYALIFLWIVVFFAVVSAIGYFRKFWHKVDDQIKIRRRRELLLLDKRRKRALARERNSAVAGEASRN
jgi:CDP-diacylglycerol---glycerol-3-phosphate 3-phosphatidyltransferase